MNLTLASSSGSERSRPRTSAPIEPVSGVTVTISSSAAIRGDHLAGQATSKFAFQDDRLAVDDGRMDALAIGLVTADSARQVANELLDGGTDRVGIEDHHVGPGADT